MVVKDARVTVLLPVSQVELPGSQACFPAYFVALP